MANSLPCHGRDTRQGHYMITIKMGYIMGKQIYLTTKEIEALNDVASEWSQIMGSGEETAELVDEKMKNGLGSALYKLNKGGYAERIYSKYVK